MKPTIGRKVWFRINGATIGEPGALQPQVFDPEQALDATVVLVHDEAKVSVNLFVVDHGGFNHSIRSVPLRQDGEAVPTGMYCEWMPYQVSQAKKDELVVPTTETTILSEGCSSGLSILRVPPERIDDVIAVTDYQVFPGTSITICCLSLRNGTKVIGYNYGSIDPTQQNWETGRREARAMAVEKVWELEGYLLRNALSQP